MLALPVPEFRAKRTFNEHLKRMQFWPSTPMRALVSQTVTFDNRTWPSGVDVVDETGFVDDRVSKLPASLRSVGRRWYVLRFALHVLRRSYKYDGMAIGRYGVWFPPLYRLLGGTCRVLMSDTEWTGSGTGRLIRLAARCADVIQANTRVEISRYSKWLNIPEHRFKFIPVAFQEYDLRSTTDSGYIFAGGVNGRDWKTLLEAITGLPYKVKIFTTERLNTPQGNIEICRGTRKEYYDAMAASSCVVVPILPEPLRITGIATYTVAMALGKPVIVTDPEGAPDYMDLGISGYFVNYGDSGGLRKYLTQLMEDPLLRSRVGEEAKKRAWRDFSPAVYQRRILQELGWTASDANSDSEFVGIAPPKNKNASLQQAGSSS